MICLFQRETEGEYFAHPLAWKELFNAKTSLRGKEDLSLVENVTHTFTIDSLSKLFMYGTYLKARKVVVKRNRLFASRYIIKIIEYSTEIESWTLLGLSGKRHQYN